MATQTPSEPLTPVERFPGERFPGDRIVVSAVMAVAIIAVFTWVGAKQGWLLLIGAALGISLFQADFGFTRGFTAIIDGVKTRQMRSQMLMLIAASALILPFLSRGSFLDTELSGKWTAIGLGFTVGAFIFGMGMQLGGGCASGCLYGAGSGGLNILFTLAAFIFGSLIGTFHLGWWNDLGPTRKFVMINDYGLLPALIINLAVGVAIWHGLATWERRRNGSVEALYQQGEGVPGPQDALQSGFLARRWPIVVGAILLAVFNMTTLWVKGSPWGITSGFALWGAKIYEALGGDVTGVDAWMSDGARKSSLDKSVFQHSTSVMNFGVVMGVFWAAWLGRRLRFSFDISAKLVAQLLIGGFLMGYGARLAAGCNIGAYFTGVASGSLAGWFWLAVAFLGNMVGLRLKRSVFAG